MPPTARLRRALRRAAVLTVLAGLSNKKGARRKPTPVMDGYEPASGWVPPSEEECGQPDEKIVSQLDDHTRVTQRLRRYEGRTVDFAVILEAVGYMEDWQEVAKIDCCHAEVHLHQRRASDHKSDSRTVIRMVTSEHDVQKVVDKAIGLIFDDYERLLEEWRR